MKRTKSGNAKLAVGYIRVSKTDQELSPEAQRAAIVAWAGREGVTVAGWHLDAGVSGGDDLADRPGFMAALADLRVRRAGVLAILRRDRLARDSAIAALLDRAVSDSGARVLCADGIGNGDSPADAFMRTILDGAAAFERAMIRARTCAALAAKRARGERTGTVRYGYRLAADGVHLDADPAEQAMIARVRELRAAGLTLRGIVATLAAEGARSRAGRPFGLTQVADLARAAAGAL